jgi:choline kinase
MLQLNKKEKLIDNQIKTIMTFNKDANIVVASGFESSKIIKYIFKKYPEVKIVENKQYKDTTPLESLRLSLNCSSPEDTYVIYGDKHFNIKAMEFADMSKANIVACGENNTKRNAGLIYQKNKLKRITYGAKKTWGQIFYIPKTIFEEFRYCVNACDKKYYNVFDIINDFLRVTDFYVHDHKDIDIKELI